MHSTGDKVFVTTDHMGEPMPLNAVIQGLQVNLTEYNVKIHEQSKASISAKPSNSLGSFKSRINYRGELGLVVLSMA